MLRSIQRLKLQSPIRRRGAGQFLIALLPLVVAAPSSSALGDEPTFPAIQAGPAVIGGLDVAWPPTLPGLPGSTAEDSPSDNIYRWPVVAPAVDIFPTVPRESSFGLKEAEELALPTAAHQDLQPSQDPIIWWNREVSIPHLETGTAIGLSLDQLFSLAAEHSAHVQAIAQQPLIAQTQIGQAQAAFDPTLFSNNRFDGTSDPAETTLATGGPPRLEDNLLGLESGLQGQLRNGATYNFSQRFGLKESNSTFFDPNQQGNSKLRANLTYPLLRGRRIDLPRSLILTANFESRAARAQFTEQFQTHLHSISGTYWQLYQERAAYVQRQRHLTRAVEIAERIEQRSQYDVQQSQWLRVKATVANRRAELLNIKANIKNLESQLRAQVNAPEIVSDRQRELLPIQEPQVLVLALDIEQEVANALARRPELIELQHRMQAARVRQQLAQDELKPQLNIVTEAYLAGLREDFDMGRAFTDSFGDRPGYAAGLLFEQPVRRRAATQALRQRTLELVQLSQLVREAEENIRAEVETAIRNIGAAEATATARYEAVVAATADMEVQYDRWLNLGSDPRLGQVQLSELLAAQDRLLQEEAGLLEATIAFSQSYLEYLRVVGGLVMVNGY